MSKYFIFSYSFAAPFFSDSETSYVKADSPQQALEKYAKNYKHPAGLFSAACYASADAYHKKPNKPLAKWLCNHQIEIERLTKHLGAYSYRGIAPGKFEIDGKVHNVNKPRAGRVITKKD